uniref:Uncharacterized protein n=1 Tax=Candidatus Methanogaster sp. ANME-2c ERB4 TaxID=2759911 RepID=A0A7G9Y522_9EURY|nr:hypothetical protein DNDEFCBC_00004 [Methanosarcinales archaeon ANME-2c ERB4]QNO43106.1 hypothetical protein GHANLPCP_00002 [Methanosarcinales archaeon ANME-2c ERB4]
MSTVIKIRYAVSDIDVAIAVRDVLDVCVAERTCQCSLFAIYVHIDVCYWIPVDVIDVYLKSAGV